MVTVASSRHRADPAHPRDHQAPGHPERLPPARPLLRAGQPRRCSSCPTPTRPGAPPARSRRGRPASPPRRLAPLADHHPGALRQHRQTALHLSPIKLQEDRTAFPGPAPCHGSGARPGHRLHQPCSAWWSRVQALPPPLRSAALVAPTLQARSLPATSARSSGFGPPPPSSAGSGRERSLPPRTAVPPPPCAASWRAAREPPGGVSCSFAPAAAPPPTPVSGRQKECGPISSGPHTGREPFSSPARRSPARAAPPPTTPFKLPTRGCVATGV
jgi:hypothetical protein